jgi:hypothetical protein
MEDIEMIRALIANSGIDAEREAFERIIRIPICKECGKPMECIYRCGNTECFQGPVD